MKHLQLPDDIAEELQRRAAEHDVSVDEYIASLLQTYRRQSDEWPNDFFDQVAGGWSGQPLARPDQGELEDRQSW